MKKVVKYVLAVAGVFTILYTILAFVSITLIPAEEDEDDYLFWGEPEEKTKPKKSATKVSFFGRKYAEIPRNRD